jgi:hypothetical protein
MKTRSIPFLKSFATRPAVGVLVGTLWLAASALPARGATAFTVDSSRSYVSVSGRVLDNPLVAQGSGSLTAHYSGTLMVELGEGTIRFPGQSRVVAMNSGSWAPRSDGRSGTEPANYGAAAGDYFTEGVAAVRNLEADVTSGTLAVVNGTFNTQGITATVPVGASSVLVYRVEGFFTAAGVIALSGGSASAQPTQGTLTTVGSQQILTIPIHSTFTAGLLSPGDSSLTVTGQVVATRTL